MQLGSGQDPDKPSQTLHEIDLCQDGGNLANANFGLWRVARFFFVASGIALLTTGLLWLHTRTSWFSQSALWTTIALALVVVATRLGAAARRRSMHDRAVKAWAAGPHMPRHIPQVGNKSARLRLIGKPLSIARVLRELHERPTLKDHNHQEPVIARASFATRPLDGLPLSVRANSLRVEIFCHVVGVGVVFGAALVMGWATRIDVTVLTLGLVAGSLLAGSLKPNYIRISPTRLEILVFMPLAKLLGRESHTWAMEIDLRTAFVVVHADEGWAQVTTRTPVSDTNSFTETVRVSPLSVSNEEEALFWATLLSAAIANQRASALPQDNLTG
jgi:hypothetical protein